MRRILMVGRVGQNCLYVCKRQMEIGRDFGFVYTGFPILNDVIDWHTSALQDWTATLYVGLHFNKGTS
jgi:hypothetical protein